MEMKLRSALPHVDKHEYIFRLLTEVLNEKKLGRDAKMVLVVDCWTLSPKELLAIIYYSELVASPLPQDRWSRLGSMALKVHSHRQQTALLKGHLQENRLIPSPNFKRKKILTTKSLKFLE